MSGLSCPSGKRELANAVLLDSVTLEFLVDDNLVGPQPWTNIEVRLSQIAGNWHQAMGMDLPAGLLASFGQRL
jgi:hypothetical protein